MTADISHRIVCESRQTCCQLQTADGRVAHTHAHHSYTILLFCILSQSTIRCMLFAQQAQRKSLNSNLYANELGPLSAVSRLSISWGIPMQSFGENKHDVGCTYVWPPCICEWWIMLSSNVHSAHSVEAYDEYMVSVCCCGGWRYDGFGVEKLPLHLCCDIVIHFTLVCFPLRELPYTRQKWCGQTLGDEEWGNEESGKCEKPRKISRVIAFRVENSLFMTILIPIGIERIICLPWKLVSINCVFIARNFCNN